MDYGDAFPVYFDYNEMYDGFSSSFPSKDNEQFSEQDYQTNYNSGGEVGRELGDKSASELIDMNSLKEYISKLDSIYPAENPELIQARILLLRYYHILQVCNWIVIISLYLFHHYTFIPITFFLSFSLEGSSCLGVGGILTAFY